MKNIIAVILLVLLFPVISFAISIPEEAADAFVLIQELGPSGKEEDLKIIGHGTIIEITDCYDEIYLLTKPSYLSGRDSIFLSFYHYSIDDNQLILHNRVTKNGHPLWFALSDGHLDLAILPLEELWGTGAIAVDTSSLKQLSLVGLGDDIAFLEYSEISIIKLNWGYDNVEGPWSFPIARSGIVSLVPKIVYYKPYPDTGYVMPDTVFYIDAKVNHGAIGSPVFSTPKDSTGYPSLIGILQGPYNGPNGDKNLGVVAPKEAIIKLLNIYHGCENKTRSNLNGR
jgi:hypothetical protein